MARREEEEDWIDEVKQREEFVVDENLHDFDVYRDEVTYRRAPDLGATAFVAARFDALDEELYHPMMMKSDNKTPAFTTETAFAPAPPVVEVKGSPDLEPSGPVPEAAIVAYHEVNPMFESDAHANDIFRKLKASIRPYVEEYVCYPDWTIDAFAMVAAEEVHFNVQLHHVPEKNVIRVDFNLREGDDYQFLEIVDKIRKDCRDLDRELAQLPEFSFDLFSSWSSSGELFPGSLTVDEEDLLLLLDDITSEHSHPFTRFEAAKQLKDYCQYTANRETLRRSHHLIAALEKMLQDDNEDIVRFAIYAILNFAQDPASWSGMNFPALPEILQTIEQNVHKRSTKKLASDLHSTILSHPSGIAVGGKQ